MSEVILIARGECVDRLLQVIGIVVAAAAGTYTSLVVINAPLHRLPVLPRHSALDDIDDVITKAAVIRNGRSDRR